MKYTGRGEMKDGGQMDEGKEGNGGKKKLPKRLPPDLENQWEELRRGAGRPLEAVMGNVLQSTLRDPSPVGRAFLGGGVRRMMVGNGVVGPSAPRLAVVIP